MMRKRRGGSLQKAMAVFLSAVLTAGMAAGAAPVSVFAQENAGTVDMAGDDAEGIAGGVLLLEDGADGETKEPAEEEAPAEGVDGGIKEPAEEETPAEGGIKEPAEEETPAEGGMKEPAEEEAPAEDAADSSMEEPAEDNALAEDGDSSSMAEPSEAAIQEFTESNNVEQAAEVQEGEESSQVTGDGSENPAPAKDAEPKTGDNTQIELCATLAMIAGLGYLLLYFADRRHGMTEETKAELVSKLIKWAKQGGKIRKLLAFAAIFLLLVYYHSIGKKTAVEWKEAYGE